MPDYRVEAVNGATGYQTTAVITASSPDEARATAISLGLVVGAVLEARPVRSRLYRIGNIAAALMTVACALTLYVLVNRDLDDQLRATDAAVTKLKGWYAGECKTEETLSSARTAFRKYEDIESAIRYR